MNIQRRGSIIAIALVMAVSPALAQSDRPQRIEITRRPERSRIGRTGVEPSRRATADTVGIVDWMGQPEAAPTLPARRTPLTVHAQDLTFKRGAYALRGTPSVTIVAQTLRIAGRITWDLSAKDPGDTGGEVTILAKDLSCAPGGQLTIISNGGNNSSPGARGAMAAP